MISTSTTERIAFTPPWLDGQPDAPVFWLRAGSVIERGQMEAELSGIHRAGKVQMFEVADAMRRGVQRFLEGDPGLEQAMELVNAEVGGDADSLSEADQQFLATLRQTLAESWPPYRDLLAQSARRMEIAPLVAFRRFCVGIDAEGVDFSLGRDGLVSDATMAALDPNWLTAAGARAFGLQYGAAGQEKNSEQPSSSDANQSDLQPGSASRAAGSSGKKRGRKTRE